MSVSPLAAASSGGATCSKPGSTLGAERYRCREFPASLTPYATAPSWCSSAGSSNSRVTTPVARGGQRRRAICAGSPNFGRKIWRSCWQGGCGDEPMPREGLMKRIPFSSAATPAAVISSLDVRGCRLARRRRAPGPRWRPRFRARPSSAGQAQPRPGKGGSPGREPARRATASAAHRTISESTRALSDGDNLDALQSGLRRAAHRPRGPALRRRQRFLARRHASSRRTAIIRSIVPTTGRTTGRAIRPNYRPAYRPAYRPHYRPGYPTYRPVYRSNYGAYYRPYYTLPTAAALAVRALGRRPGGVSRITCIRQPPTRTPIPIPRRSIQLPGTSARRDQRRGRPEL